MRNPLLLQVAVDPADSGNPGIPPASLSSFLRVKPLIQGVVLAEHSAAFTNPYYQSQFDDSKNIEPESLAAAAVVVAQALHRLAAGSQTQQLKVTMKNNFVAGGCNCWGRRMKSNSTCLSSQQGCAGCANWAPPVQWSLWSHDHRM